jgi:hypothetical protein
MVMASNVSTKQPGANGGSVKLLMASLASPNQTAGARAHASQAFTTPNTPGNPHNSDVPPPPLESPGQFGELRCDSVVDNECFMC